MQSFFVTRSGQYRSASGRKCCPTRTRSNGLWARTQSTSSDFEKTLRHTQESCIHSDRNALEMVRLVLH